MAQGFINWGWPNFWVTGFKTNSMYLTNECKKDFEAWYLKRYHFTTPNRLTRIYLWFFYRLDLSKQYSVYIDFADSKDITIYIAAAIDQAGIINCMAVVNKKAVAWVNTRRKARLNALAEFDSIYNY